MLLLGVITLIKIVLLLIIDRRIAFTLIKCFMCSFFCVVRVFINEVNVFNMGNRASKESSPGNSQEETEEKLGVGESITTDKIYKERDEEEIRQQAVIRTFAGGAALGGIGGIVGKLSLESAILMSSTSGGVPASLEVMNIINESEKESPEDESKVPTYNV